MGDIHIVGPALLTFLGWAQAWLTGSTSARRRAVGWVLAGALLAPTSRAYAWATGQYPYVLANGVFAVLALRAFRVARRYDHGHVTTPDQRREDPRHRQ